LKAVKLFGQLELGFDNYSTLPLELALVDCVLTPEGEGGPATQTEYESRQPIKAATPSYPRQPTDKPEPAIVSPPAMPEAAVTTTPPAVPEAATTITPPAVPEAATAITPPEAGGELEQLRLNWKQVVAQAPEDTKRTPAIAILRSAGVKPVSFEDDTVVLAFRYPLHKENMEKLENQRVAEKILSHFLGHPCHIRCTHEPEDNHLLRAALQIGAQIIDVEEK